MDGQHILVVPESLDEPMEVDHPGDCPQHGHRDTVRNSDGSFACPVESEKWCEGLETFFRREPQPGPFEHGTVYVAPGRHVIERWDDRRGDDWDGGLRLVEGGDAA